MKNIHILPTDKPSRLWLSTRKENYLIFDKFPRGGVEYVEPKNIYITSEKDIKDNDWIITKDGRLVQVSYLLSKELDNASKIILTTDQDLISDNVQAIDKEFLEWFANNSSCEYVEVQKFNGFAEVYLTSIPKEESNYNMKDEIEWLSNNPQCKQIESCSNSLSKKCICPKEETLEEAMNQEGYMESDYDKIWRDGVEFGSKWQAERMYSEEEVISIFKEWEEFNIVQDSFDGQDDLTFIEWFKQFKNK